MKKLLIAMTALGVVVAPSVFGQLAVVQTQPGVHFASTPVMTTNRVQPIVVNRGFLGSSQLVVVRNPVHKNLVIATKQPLYVVGSGVYTRPLTLARGRDLVRIDNGDGILTLPEAKAGGVRFIGLEKGKLRSLSPQAVNFKSLDLRTGYLRTTSGKVFPVVKTRLGSQANWLW